MPLKSVNQSALLFCVVGSLAAHGLFLGMAWRAEHQGMQSSVRAMSVSQAVVRAKAGARPTEAPQHADSSDLFDTRMGSTAAWSLDAAVASLGVENQASSFVTSTGALADVVGLDSPLPALVLPSGAFDEWATYIPRPRLTVAPIMQQALILSWPEGWLKDGQFRGVAALYIDEEGMVRRVRIEGDSLPAAFQDLARQTFLGTRFSPGELLGDKVKSLIRIEISFEARAQAQGRGAPR